MTHRSSGMETARANCPQHTGTTEKIRGALRHSAGPLSVYKLHLATGLEIRVIRKALKQMMSRTGGVVSLPGPKAMAYALYTPPGKVSEPVAGEEFRIAGRITIPQYRYGGSRLS